MDSFKYNDRNCYIKALGKFGQLFLFYIKIQVFKIIYSLLVF